MLEIFKANAPDDMIGERELRKVLFEYLGDPHDHYITTIVSNLKFSLPPSNSSFFRRFLITEVIEMIDEILMNDEQDLDIMDSILLKNQDKSFKDDDF